MTSLPGSKWDLRGSRRTRCADAIAVRTADFAPGIRSCRGSQVLVKRHGACWTLVYVGVSSARSRNQVDINRGRAALRGSPGIEASGKKHRQEGGWPQSAPAPPGIVIAST